MPIQTLAVEGTDPHHSPAMKAKRKNRLGSSKRAQKTRSVAAFVNPIAKKALGGRPLALRELILSWRAAVGPDFATGTRPQAISRARAGEACLTLAVDPRLALAVQHDSQRLIDRVNTYFGYKLINRLKLVQRVIQPQDDQTSQPDLPVNNQDRQAVQAKVERISDDQSRAILQEMGELISVRRRRRLALQKSGITPN
ncbi:MAG: DciA family protein [Pseudomonadota bacterium]